MATRAQQESGPVGVSGPDSGNYGWIYLCFGYNYAGKPYQLAISPGRSASRIQVWPDQELR